MHSVTCVRESSRAPSKLGQKSDPGNRPSAKLGTRGFERHDSTLLRHAVILGLVRRSLSGNFAYFDRANGSSRLAHGVFGDKKCRRGDDTNRRALGTGLNHGKPRSPVTAHGRNWPFNADRFSQKRLGPFEQLADGDANCVRGQWAPHSRHGCTGYGIGAYRRTIVANGLVVINEAALIGLRLG